MLKPLWQCLQLLDAWGHWDFIPGSIPHHKMKLISSIRKTLYPCLSPSLFLPLFPSAPHSISFWRVFFFLLKSASATVSMIQWSHRCQIFISLCICQLSFQRNFNPPPPSPSLGPPLCYTESGSISASVSVHPTSTSPISPSHYHWCLDSIRRISSWPRITYSSGKN